MNLHVNPHWRLKAIQLLVILWRVTQVSLMLWKEKELLFNRFSVKHFHIPVNFEVYFENKNLECFAIFDKTWFLYSQKEYNAFELSSFKEHNKHVAVIENVACIYSCVHFLATSNSTKREILRPLYRLCGEMVSPLLGFYH